MKYRKNILAQQVSSFYNNNVNSNRSFNTLWASDKALA